MDLNYESREIVVFFQKLLILDKLKTMKNNVYYMIFFFNSTVFKHNKYFFIAMTINGYHISW